MIHIHNVSPEQANQFKFCKTLTTTLLCDSESWITRKEEHKILINCFSPTHMRYCSNHIFSYLNTKLDAGLLYSHLFLLEFR